MANMTAAAKTLKTLDPEGKGLRCVESAPLTNIREQLKTIRRSAGPGIGSVLMGELEFPRKKQGVLMDSVLAVRMPLYRVVVVYRRELRVRIHR